MDEQHGQMLLDRWVEDEGFRTQMRSDPSEPPHRPASS